METLAPLFGYPAQPGFKERGGTSEEAARRTAPRQKTLQAAVLRVLRDLPAGLTADEAAAFLGRSELSIRPRLSELLRQGDVVKTDTRRRNRSGLTATVYRAVPPCA